MSHKNHTGKNWDELSPRRRRTIVLTGAAQVSLAAWAAHDLWRRPAEQVKGGHKLPWALALGVNWVGPLTYLFVGRTQSED